MLYSRWASGKVSKEREEVIKDNMVLVDIDVKYCRHSLPLSTLNKYLIIKKLVIITTFHKKSVKCGKKILKRR